MYCIYVSGALYNWNTVIMEVFEFDRIAVNEFTLFCLIPHLQKKMKDHICLVMHSKESENNFVQCLTLSTEWMPLHRIRCSEEPVLSVNHNHMPSLL